MGNQEKTLSRIETLLVNIEAQLRAINAQMTGDHLAQAMTSKECAEYLGISMLYLRELVSKRRIPVHKNLDGTRNMFYREEIDSWRTGRPAAKRN